MILGDAIMQSGRYSNGGLASDAPMPNALNRVFGTVNNAVDDLHLEICHYVWWVDLCVVSIISRGSNA